MGQIGAQVKGPRVYLDTNIFIYALENFPAYAPVVNEIFSRIDSGEMSGVTSELTIAETLVKPLMDNDKRLYHAYLDALQPRNGLRLAPIDRDILISAAALRAAHSQIRLPDAIHVATAFEHECATFLTNDSRLSALASGKDINIVLLSSLASS